MENKKSTFLVAEKEWYETDQDKTGWDCDEWKLISNGEPVPDNYEIDEILDTDKYYHPTKATFKKIKEDKDHIEGDLNIGLDLDLDLKNKQSDSIFLIEWKKQFNSTNFNPPLFHGKICLSPDKYKQSCIDLIKLAENSIKNEFQDKLKIIVNDLKSYDLKINQIIAELEKITK